VLTTVALAVLTVVALGGLSAYLYRTLHIVNPPSLDDPKPWWVVLLALVPVVYSLWFLWKFRRDQGFFGRHAWVPCAALFLLGLAFGAYAFKTAHSPGLLELLGLAALCFACGLVFWALWLTSHLVQTRRPDEQRESGSLLVTLREHPFEALCFFLVLFCFVGLFLSFSLAFHDQGLKSREPRQYGLVAIEPIPGLRSPAANGEPAGSPDPGSHLKTWKLQFENGQSEIRWDEGFASVGDNAILSLPSDRQGPAYNAQTLSNLVGKIEELVNKGSVLVLLAGHASPAQPSSNGVVPGYRSNFELSEARAHRVKAEILKRLDSKVPQWTRDVAWQILPLSDVNVFLGKKDGYQSEIFAETEDRLMVEVAILQTDDGVADLAGHTLPDQYRELSLLDYVYFTIYTITTTGYGDIVPVSPFTKFVSTVANLFEVIFIVIFFNTLMSFLHQGQGHEGLGGEDPGKPASDSSGRDEDTAVRATI